MKIQFHSSTPPVNDDSILAFGPLDIFINAVFGGGFLGGLLYGVAPAALFMNDGLLILFHSM